MKGRKVRKVKNYSGLRFGMLVVLPEFRKESEYYSWKVRCDCGNTKWVTTGALSKNKSCGCLMEKYRLSGKRKYNEYDIIYDPIGAFVLVDLGHNQFGKVDIDVWEKIKQYKWIAHWSKHAKRYYASSRSKFENNVYSLRRMHRVVLGLEDPNVHIDHINLDSLDNRDSNLRLDLEKRNSQNTLLNKRSTSGYKGVTVHKKIVKGVEYKYWTSNIGYKNKRIRLALTPFTEEGKIEAAMAYDKGSLFYHKEWGRLNFSHLKERYLKELENN